MASVGAGRLGNVKGKIPDSPDRENLGGRRQRAATETDSAVVWREARPWHGAELRSSSPQGLLALLLE